MRKRASVFILGVLFLGVAVSGACQETLRQAKIIEVQGRVFVRQGKKKWTEAKENMVLNSGDVIKTQRHSSALININGSGETATVEVSENSQLLLSKLIEDQNKGTQDTLLDLAIGKVLIEAEKLHSEESKFEVKTPTSIVGVRGTTFAVEVEAIE